jgi:vacuolar-type H+-ATPase subunit F/Vma7
MVTYREFERESERYLIIDRNEIRFVNRNEKYLVIVGKVLEDSSIPELKKILRNYKNVDRIYVITKNISPKVANLLRELRDSKDSTAIVIIDDLPFDGEEDAFQKISKIYGLKEINYETKMKK